MVATLHSELAMLSAVQRRDSIHRQVDRRKTRHRWAAPPCATCGGFGVLGSAKAHTRCPNCQRATR